MHMQTFNCARVFIGDCIFGSNASDYHTVIFKYDVVEGAVTLKILKPIQVPIQDYGGKLKNHDLNVFVLYPAGEDAIVRIAGRNGMNTVTLVKPQVGQPISMYKESLFQVGT